MVFSASYKDHGPQDFDKYCEYTLMHSAPMETDVRLLCAM